MWTPRFRTGEKTAVGLSWMLEEVTGHQTWTWTGDIGTSGSVFRVLPNQNLGVAVMANYDAPRPLNQLAEDIVTIALGGEPPARPSPVNPSDLPAVEPDRRPWDSYVGLYAGPRDALRVMRDGGHLVAKITGGDLLGHPLGLLRRR